MDDELRVLMIAELERHLADLGSSGGTNARRVAHALKGSFGMLSERAASDTFARLERRLLAGDDTAVGEIIQSVTTALEALRGQKPLVRDEWPEPPNDLRPSRIAPDAHREYAADAHDHIARIDRALMGIDAVGAVDAALEVFREVHTMKGAALSIGDEVMAWFCHGLEDRLRNTKSMPVALAALREVDQYRGILAEILDAPEHALESLRLMAGAPARGSRPPTMPLSQGRPPSVELGRDSSIPNLADEGTIRVASPILETIFERAGQITQLRARIVANGAAVHDSAHQAQDVAREVRDAIRMIGPPRPWGAPLRAIQTLERCAKRLDPLAATLRASSDAIATLGGRLAKEGDALTSTVASIGTASVGMLFDRVGSAVQTEAKRLEKSVDVVTSGGETPVDRRLVDALIEPLRQLARNAVVHGLEPESERVAAGKNRRGTLKLSATRRAGMLVLVITDDGAGVDTERVRAHAVDAGLVTDEITQNLSRSALLALLFYPGFSLRKEADLLAGRGVGLDLTLAAIHRLGGSIHLDSSLGHGLTATVVVPAEGTLVKVLWLETGGTAFGIAVQHTGEARRIADVPEAKNLGDIVRTACAIEPGPPTIAIAVTAPFDEDKQAWIAAEKIGPVEEIALRALPPLVSATGPWAGAALWADEIRLVMDPTRLVREVVARSDAGGPTSPHRSSS